MPDYDRGKAQQAADRALHAMQVFWDLRTDENLESAIDAYRELVRILPWTDGDRGIVLIDLAELLGNRWKRTRRDHDWVNAKTEVIGYGYGIRSGDWRWPPYVLATARL